LGQKMPSKSIFEGKRKIRGVKKKKKINVAGKKG